MHQETVLHYCDVIMGTMASQITSIMIVYSVVYSGPDQRKHQSSASLAFVRGIHRWPVNSRHKWPVTRKMFPCDDVFRNIWGAHVPFIHYHVPPTKYHRDVTDKCVLYLNIHMSIGFLGVIFREPTVVITCSIQNYVSQWELDSTPDILEH